MRTKQKINRKYNSCIYCFIYLNLFKAKSSDKKEDHYWKYKSMEK